SVLPGAPGAGGRAGSRCPDGPWLRGGPLTAVAQHLDQHGPRRVGRRDLAGERDAHALETVAAPDAQLEAETVYPDHRGLVGLDLAQHPREGQERVGVVTVHVG